MRWLFRLCAAALIVIASTAAVAQQSTITANQSTNARPFSGQVGRHVTFVCPSNINVTQDIWGTDVYADDSPICTAAVHAGVLTPGISSQVTIVMGGAAESLQAAQRNGVTSLSYGPWGATYSFSQSGEPGQIDWNTTYELLPPDFLTPITVVCPPKGKVDPYVWGTDVYTSSSAICVAAVHAGIITLDAGGRVTVTLQPKQEAFVASVRNGVSTQDWSDWNFQSYPRPFKVTPGAIAVTAPTSAPAREVGPRQAPASSSSPPGPRTITLAGFTAAGTATPIVPRTISLSGFSASGTATPIVPRTIQIPGWTGVGTPTTP